MFKKTRSGKKTVKIYAQLATPHWGFSNLVPNTFYLAWLRSTDFESYAPLPPSDSHDFRDYIRKIPSDFRFLLLCLKSVFGKFRFHGGLVWTVGLTIEIKLCFRGGLVWTVGLTVEIKLCFRDGLVWTVDPTVEIKLRFRISPM